SRRRHTRFSRDWSSDVCSSDLQTLMQAAEWTPVIITEAGKLLHTHDDAPHHIQRVRLKLAQFGQGYPGPTLSLDGFNIFSFTVRSEVGRVVKCGSYRPSHVNTD